ncbi:hypothetical protein R16034_00827 [Ralstonia edaphis]|uniref:Uncharacterized protein n=1 Tax=Ralstonia edaphi TaxID=3058599 RepID=A0AB72X3N9_9RALS|nr:hypothetical protein [Ralstonia sp. LMG 6871]CAJ0737728.1 hypothetical protein R16034_00827 [Ralstonia sp. LMG 6871]
MGLNTSERYTMAVEVVKAGLTHGTIKLHGALSDPEGHAERDAKYLVRLIQDIVNGLDAK